jgi:hypothetical protein
VGGERSRTVCGGAYPWTKFTARVTATVHKIIVPNQLKASDTYTNEFNFYRTGKQADAK